MARKKDTTYQAQTKALAARLKTAFETRCAYLQANVETVAEAIDRDASSIYDNLGGRARFYFQDLLVIDQYFASRGAPGLIADLSAPASWTAKDIPFDHAKLLPSARRLLQVRDRLLNGGLTVMTTLAEANLLGDAHIMAVADNRVKVGYCGSNMVVDPSVVTKDVRELRDQDYGRFIEQTLPPVIKAVQPAYQLITSADGSMIYTRTSVPIDENRIAAVTELIKVPANYKLS